MPMRQALAAGVLALTAATAAAQTPAQPATPAAATTSTDTRPATTTFQGDTGLWTVPTGEVLPDRRWSVSAYRVNFDDNQGFSDISNWPVTFGFGLKNKAEIFGAFTVVSRVDRDIRPLFVQALPGAGGTVPTNPLMTDTWSGSKIGDFWIGAKWNLMSQFDQKPVAFALRPMLKLPTGDSENGAGTGKLDFAVDAVVSKEVNERVEASGYAGFIVRGSPDAVESTNGFRWGVGIGVPARKSLRFTAELTGESYFDSSLALKSQLLGTDGSFLPTGFISDVKSPVDLNLGLTWQGAKGVFAGVGWTYRFTVDKRDEFLSGPTNGAGDRMDIVGRIGYHPGVRIYVPPPAPMPEPPKAPEPVNRPPTVRAACNPCTVYVGKTSTVTATAQDPDGDPLTYRWSAPAGTFTAGTAASTPWTAPMVEGPVQVTVTVSDGKGGTASDVVTIQVIKEAVKEVVFEDVHFDFDRYSLRPEALRALDEAVRSLNENPTLRITVEGHTCNIGTAEYNLALGERRASSVREYLASRGIGADRLQMVSYGEERPKHDNAREETRRLNRRAALVVRLQ
jgi:outer membrane protein OmpA-like peptidoglycan-associated protein